MRALAAWGGAALAGTSVAGYWAYTLLGVERLGPLLLRPRRLTAFGGGALAGMSLLGPPGPLTLSGAAVTTGLLTYALRNQWLVPKPATALAPSSRAWPRREPVIVLPDGSALPVRWASRLRTASVGPWLVVHCGLARSVSVFDAPDTTLAAVLPHATGFWVGRGGAWGGGPVWDGVDGTARGDAAALRRARVQLARVRDVTGLILAPVGDPEPPPASRRRPRVPGARGVADPLDWGLVETDWTPASLDEAPWTDSGYFLSRWAARQRGLAGTERSGAAGSVR